MASFTSTGVEGLWPFASLQCPSPIFSINSSANVPPRRSGCRLEVYGASFKVPATTYPSAGLDLCNSAAGSVHDTHSCRRVVVGPCGGGDAPVVMQLWCGGFLLFSNSVVDMLRAASRVIWRHAVITQPHTYTPPSLTKRLL